MHPDDVTAPEPPDAYRPSGRVDFLRTIPLLLAGAAVAIVMAFAVLLAEENYYFYFITPLILGAPVFGMIWLAVRGGRCRNRGFAGFAGVVLAFVYYAGYWELSYLANVVARGPAMVALAEAVGGLPGLPGYVVFRCKTSRPVDAARGGAQAPRPPGVIDMIFNGVFFGMETLTIVGIATAIGRGTASRVYSERLRRWASSTECSLPILATNDVLAAVDFGDWAAVGALPRSSGKMNGGVPGVVVRIEHFPSDPDEPAYVSVLGGGKANRIVQRAIPADQMEAVAREFPDVKRPPGEAAGVGSSNLQESIDRLGLVDAPRPAVDADFRAAAVAASLARLKGRPVEGLDVVPASLCLPASEDGPRRMRRASWAVFLLIVAPIVAAFGSMGLMLYLSSQVKGPNGAETPLSEAYALAGIIGFFGSMAAGMVIWFGGFRHWRGFLARRIHGRPGTPVDGRPDLPTRVLALENARTFDKPKLVGDDFGIAFFDRDGRRIVYEGLRHRYVIRGEDVAAIWPVPSASNVAARVDYRIGDVVLPLVFTTPNHWVQVPLAGGISKRLIVGFFADFTDALGCEIGAAPVA